MKKENLFIPKQIKLLTGFPLYIGVVSVIIGGSKDYAGIANKRIMAIPDSLFK